MLTLCIISEKFEKKKKRKTRKIYKKKKKNRSKGHRWKSLDSMGRIVRISVHEMYFLYENKLFLQMSFNLSSRELYFERFIQIYSQISLDSKTNSKRSWCYFLIFSCSILRIRYTSHTWYFNSAIILNPLKDKNIIIYEEIEKRNYIMKWLNKYIFLNHILRKLIFIHSLQKR